MLTSDMMHHMWPNGDAKVHGLVDGIMAAAPAVFPKYGLTSDLVIAHAMAQFSHECGAGTAMVENINYSASRACAVWPSRFSDEASVYAMLGSAPGDPDFRIKLMDNVYGNRMGNRPGTHDGSTFIGRGLSQVTGREGYEKLGATGRPRSGQQSRSRHQLRRMPSNAALRISSSAAACPSPKPTMCRA